MFVVSESEGHEEVDGGRQRNHSSELPTAGTSENRENAHPRTRKRQRHESKAQKRKRARNSGLPSSRGKEVAGKLYQNFDCKCKKIVCGERT